MRWGRLGFLNLLILIGAQAGCGTDPVPDLRLLYPSMVNGGAQVTIAEAQLYAERGGQKLYYDMYRPAISDQPVPLVILVHGGGWSGGSRSELIEFGFDLAANGYAAAAIDYRLARDGVVFPAPVTDILAAVRFFRDSAETMQIDPQRIAVMGESAGGHLALLAGMSADTSVFDTERPIGEAPGIKAIINIAGPTDLTAGLSSMPDWVVDSIENFLGVPIEHSGEIARAASPVTYARADAPPLLNIHGNADSTVPVMQAQLLTAVLNLVGARYVYVEVPGMEHLAGLIWYSDYTQRYRTSLLQFLRDNL